MLNRKTWIRQFLQIFSAIEDQRYRVLGLNPLKNVYLMIVYRYKPIFKRISANFFSKNTCVEETVLLCESGLQGESSRAFFGVAAACGSAGVIPNRWSMPLPIENGIELRSGWWRKLANGKAPGIAACWRISADSVPCRSIWARAVRTGLDWTGWAELGWPRRVSAVWNPRGGVC